MSLRFCSWVVAEDENEDLVTVTDEVDYAARSHSPVATITEEESFLYEEESKFNSPSTQDFIDYQSSNFQQVQILTIKKEPTLIPETSSFEL